MFASHRALLLTFFFIVTLSVVTPASTLLQRPRQLTSSSFSDVQNSFSFVSSPDNWLGGSGNWSNPADWSSGLPSSSSDVTIFTGDDHVSLDTSPTIQSLTLGGSSASFQSVLETNFTPQTLNISGDLTINPTGYLFLRYDTVNVGGNATDIGGMLLDFGSTLNVTGNMENDGPLQMTAFGGGGDRLTVGGTFTNDHGSFLYIIGPNDTVNLGSLVNHGTIELGPGSTLNLTNQPGGLSDIPSDAEYEVNGTFTAGTGSGFANLQTVEGRLYLENGMTTVVAPTTGTLTLNAGIIVLDNSSTLQVNGNFNVGNGDVFTSGSPPGGANALNVSGVLTIGNGGSVQMGIYGFDSATVRGGIVNNGYLNLEAASLTTPMLANGTEVDLQTNSSLLVGQAGLHPGAGAGYHQFASGVLEELIAPSAFGVIGSSIVSLDGTLDIQLLDGYEPPVNSIRKFILFQPGGLTGEFSTIENDVFNGGTEKWVLDYDQADGYVELIAESNVATTPEPGSILLLATGILTVAGAYRRKR